MGQRPTSWRSVATVGKGVIDLRRGLDMYIKVFLSASGTDD